MIFNTETDFIGGFINNPMGRLKLFPLYPVAIISRSLTKTHPAHSLSHVALAATILAMARKYSSRVSRRIMLNKASNKCSRNYPEILVLLLLYQKALV